MKQGYRGLVVRVIEIEYDVWAESKEEAMRMLDEEQWLKVRTTVHNDEVVDMYEHDHVFDC